MRFLYVVLFFSFFSCTSSDDVLNIACASNMEPVIDSIAEIYSKETGIECEVISGASGTLSTQIEAGSNFEVFISADEQFPERIHQLGLSGKPRKFVKGDLIMVILIDNDSNLSIEWLLNLPDVRKIGIADPEVSPFGKETKDFLTDLHQWDRLQDKFVYGESIEQVNAYINAEAVDVAFTSKSFKIQSGLKDKCKEIGGYPRPQVVHHVVALHQNGAPTERSQNFINFLYSQSSSKILQYFGYSLTN